MKHRDLGDLSLAPATERGYVALKGFEESASNPDSLYWRQR
jgi:hypothetical protein